MGIVEDALEEADALVLRRHNDRLRTELAVANRAIRKQGARIDELEQLMDRFRAVRPADQAVPKWLTPKASRARKHHATALLMLSDLHLDEVVDPLAMAGMNAYDRDIATQRLERVVEGTVTVASRFVAGVEWDGLVVALNGDILTGEIHDELARTNEAPTAASVTYWVPRLASALTYLADHFGRVHVPCTDGNHDRTYKKIPAKQRAESSWAWVVYNWLADMVRDDKRITFDIDPSEGRVYPIYDTWFHQIHGDGFRSAGGIGGIYPSMLKYLHRMDAMWAAHGKRIDVHLMGHWHTYLTGPNFLVNGSLKGYDEYARHGGFRPEKPRQAFAVVTPERGITQQMPIYAD